MTKRDPKLEALRAEVKTAERVLMRGTPEDASEVKGAEGVNFLAYQAAFMRLDAYTRSQVEEVSPSRQIRAAA
jgi:hypothetical protein